MTAGHFFFSSTGKAGILDGIRAGEGTGKK